MHRDLLRQARQLATVDVKKPKQANLRRAVSATYYAVFHFLVREACCVQFGTQHRQAAFRHVLARAFAHSTMRKACAAFGGGTLKASVLKGLPKSFQVPQALRDIAVTFVDLQGKRHVADYDLSERFSRSDMLTLVEETQNCLKKFEDLPASDEKRFFLACLWAWNSLTER